jgi:hypothetical protein
MTPVQLLDAMLLHLPHTPQSADRRHRTVRYQRTGDTAEGTVWCAVAVVAQHGRKWSLEATGQHARCHEGSADVSEREND